LTSGATPLLTPLESRRQVHRFPFARDEGKIQVWLLNRLGGESRAPHDTSQDVEDFAWSPDSRQLVLILRDLSPEELDAAKNKSAKESASSEKDKKSRLKSPGSSTACNSNSTKSASLIAAVRTSTYST